MMRRIIIGASLVLIPLTIWVALQYGQPDVVTFLQAVERATATNESDQAPKVIIEATIVSVGENNELLVKDKQGTAFSVEYTASAPPIPFAAGQHHRLLGHVHGGTPPTFHASQRFNK